MCLCSVACVCGVWCVVVGVVGCSVYDIYSERDCFREVVAPVGLVEERRTPTTAEFKA